MKLSEAHKRKQNLCWNRFSERTIPRLTMSRREPANWSHVFARLGCLLKWWWAYNSGKVIMFTLCETWRWVTWGRDAGWSDNTEPEFGSFSLPVGDLMFLENQHVQLKEHWGGSGGNQMRLHALCQRYCRQQQPYKANRSIHLWEIEHRVYLADVTVCSLWHAWKPASIETFVLLTVPGIENEAMGPTVG